jgi:hypothetical protein
MKIRTLQITCEIPSCVWAFKAQFVDQNEYVRLLNLAKRDGWRRVRIGEHMSDVCPYHPEII